MNYIKQEEIFGCAFACMAMILETSYWSVRNDFPIADGTGKKYGKQTGIGVDFQGASYMFEKGFLSHTEYPHLCHKQITRKKEDWIREFAPVHIVCVYINGRGGHAVVWKNGIIYDPHKGSGLKITDYSDVVNITGFWKINKL